MALSANAKALLVETGELSRFTGRFFLQGFRPGYELRELVMPGDAI